MGRHSGTSPLVHCTWGRSALATVLLLLAPSSLLIHITMSSARTQVRFARLQLYAALAALTASTHSTPSPCDRAPLLTPVAPETVAAAACWSLSALPCTAHW